LICRIAVARAAQLHPVAKVAHAVLLKPLPRVVTKAGVEFVELAGRRVIRAQLEKALVRGGAGEGRGHQRQGDKGNHSFHKAGSL